MLKKTAVLMALLFLTMGTAQAEPEKKSSPLTGVEIKQKMEERMKRDGEFMAEIRKESSQINQNFQDTFKSLAEQRMKAVQAGNKEESEAALTQMEQLKERWQQETKAVQERVKKHIEEMSKPPAL